MEIYEYGYLYLVGTSTDHVFGYHAVAITGGGTEVTQIPIRGFQDRLISIMNGLGATGWALSDLRPVTLLDRERFADALGERASLISDGFCCFMRRRIG